MFIWRPRSRSVPLASFAWFNETGEMRCFGKLSMTFKQVVRVLMHECSNPIN